MMATVPNPSKLMTQSPSDQLPPFFDKNPELKARLQEYLRSIPDEQKKKNVDLFRKFITGELTWAEIKQVPKALLKELAKIGYLRLQQKDYQGAEIIFKGLAIIDHSNWYYRAALGAVFQKRGLYDQAIEEYTISLGLKSDEPTSLVNRGECSLRQSDLDAALEDFALVQKLNLPEDNPWKKRAQLLSRMVLEQQGKS